MPVATVVTTPLVPAALLIVATLVVSEVQATAEEISWVVPSVKVPVAIKRWLVALAIEGVVGDIAMEVKAALLTTKAEVPVLAPEVAVMTMLPDRILVKRPAESMVAMLLLLEDQVTVDVKSWVVPSV